MNKQKIKLYNILKYPLLFIFVMWGVKLFEVYKLDLRKFERQTESARMSVMME